MVRISTVLMACAMLAPVGSAVAADGEEIYNTRCAACHAAGVANAPKLGDKEAWAPRIEAGNDAMMAIIMSGKGAMPPKGACADCSDEDLQAALDYMVSQVQ